MTTARELGLTHTKWDRTNATESVSRIARTTNSTGITNAYVTYMTVPLGQVALIDEITIIRDVANGAAATETVFLEFTNVEDQIGQMAAGDSGAAAGVPTGTSETVVTTEVPFILTKTANDNVTYQYVWKLNGDLCLASGPLGDPNASAVSTKNAKIRVKNSAGTFVDSVQIQYRLMTRQKAIAQGEFRPSFIRACTLPISTSSVDVLLARQNQSIEINAIAATGNARTTATTESVRLRFSDNFTSTPSKNFIICRFLSKNLTAASVGPNVAVFNSGLHIRGPADYRVTSLASANVASTMSVAIVGQYVRGRDPENLASKGATGAIDPALATGTASAGAANTLTVEVGKTLTANTYTGHLLILTGGTGAGQTRYIASNTAGPPGVITVSANWTVNPDATTTYLIAQYKTRHETYEATGVAQQGLTVTQASLDATGFERGVKYFWFYTENGTLGDEKCFCDTSGATSPQEYLAKLKGYMVSMDPGASTPAAIALSGGTSTAPLCEFLWTAGAAGEAASKTLARDNVMAPVVTRSVNLAMSRAGGGGMNNLGCTVFGTLHTALVSPNFVAHTYSGG